MTSLLATDNVNAGRIAAELSLWRSRSLMRTPKAMWR